MANSNTRCDNILVLAQMRFSGKHVGYSDYNY